MDVEQYTADGFCDLTQEITERFYQTPQKIKVSRKLEILHFSRANNICD